MSASEPLPRKVFGHGPAQGPRLRERGAADGVFAQVLLHGVQLRGQVVAARTVPLQVWRLLPHPHPHQSELCQLWSAKKGYGMFTG